MTGNSNSLRHGTWRLLLVASVMLLTACGGEYPQTTFEPVTDFGILLNEVFATTVWWTMGILVVVLSLIIVAVIRSNARF